MTSERNRKQPNDPGALDQRTRFIEAAREAGASEDEAVFDANLKKIVKAKMGADATSPLKEVKGNGRK